MFLLNPGDPTRAACLTVAALLAYLYQTGILALLFPPLFGRPLPLDQQDEDFPGGAAPRRPAEQQQEGGEAAAAAAAGGAGGPLAEGQQQAPPVHQVQEPSGYLSQIARQVRQDQREQAGRRAGNETRESRQAGRQATRKEGRGGSRAAVVPVCLSVCGRGWVGVVSGPGAGRW